MKLEEMTIEELNSLADDLSRQRREIKKRALEVAAVRHQKLLDANLQAKIARWKPHERRRIIIKPGVAEASGGAS